MRIGLYTSTRYLEPKTEAIKEAVRRLGIQAEIVHDESLERPSSSEQAFGFEELFERSKFYAAQAARREDVDVGVGIQNSLAFIYSANEWYYVICVALCTKGGIVTSNFTTGIAVPESMVKQVQNEHIKIDTLTLKLGSENDPVAFFSAKTLTRKDLMVPALLLAFAKLNIPAASAPASPSGSPPPPMPMPSPPSPLV